MRSPSKKAIQEAFHEITDEVVAEFKRMIAANEHPVKALEYIGGYTDGAFGVEYIPSNKDTWFTYSGIAYINTGETYNTTPYWDKDTSCVMLGCWGDRVEKFPRRFMEGIKHG